MPTHAESDNKSMTSDSGDALDAGTRYTTAPASLQELEETYFASNTPDWDGEGAMPVKRSTYDDAADLLHRILCYHPEFPEPVTGSLPDGLLTLDWRASRERSLMAIIGADRRIGIALELDGKYTSQTLDFLPHSIPEPLLAGLRALFA